MVPPELSTRTLTIGAPPTLPEEPTLPGTSCRTPDAPETSRTAPCSATMLPLTVIVPPLRTVPVWYPAGL